MEEEYNQASLLEIAHKLSFGKVTAEEKAYFDKWYNSYNDELLEVSEGNENDILQIRDRIHNQLLLRIANQNKVKSVKIRLVWLKFAAAAVILISGLTFYISTSNHSKTPPLTNSLAKSDILPGKNTATLTLANGKKIILSEAIKGELANESGISISKDDDGKLTYNLNNPNAGEQDETNTLSTTNGETFQLRLPDGSMVFLNAASSLTYAATLNVNGQRKVKLNGEAYFEVAKDKAHPFIVTTDKQEVMVLGTHFNVNSYQDEPVKTTTLLEGSVRVVAAGVEKLLKPGQASLLKDNAIVVAEANTALVTAWKDGKMAFKKTEIETVLRQISRWYNIDIVYMGKIPNYTITGEVSRKESLSSVLKVLALSGVNFELRDRKLMIRA